MTSIIVCPLSRLASVARSSGADNIITLMRRDGFDGPPLAPARHLWLELSDITAPRDDYVLPGAGHVEALLGFVEGWDRRRPLLIHCYAGVSRSTAAAFVLACALRPDVEERALAARLRALSPTATPNPRLIALGDATLGRAGRMTKAIEDIGRGAECFEGVPFSFDLDAQIPPYQS